MPRYLQIFAIFSLCSLSLVSCSGQKGADNPMSGPEPGAEAPGASGGAVAAEARVRAAPCRSPPHRSSAKAVPVTIPSVGAAEAAQTVQIRAQVTGQLSAVNFSEGQEVKKGDPLFTIDPRPFEAVVAQAEAVLSRDTATATNQAAQRARYEDLYKRSCCRATSTKRRWRPANRRRRRSRPTRPRSTARS